MNISTVASQYASRPADQRFPTLTALNARMQIEKANSIEMQLDLRSLEAIPTSDNQGLLIQGKSKNPVPMTNWAFRQMCIKTGTPTEYLSRLPANIGAQCFNHGISKLAKDDGKVKGLFTRYNPDTDDEYVMMRAATGPEYGRVYQAQITHALVERFGDGRTGTWKSPREFGEDGTITDSNTTFFGSDRDVFVFLCDESKSISVKNRRNGEPGNMARGFYIYNSDVGAQTLGIAAFYFDYVCKNRNIWGVSGFTELKFKHSKTLPERWITDLTPQLLEYSNASAKPLENQIALAQAFKIEEPEEWLGRKTAFSKPVIRQISKAHMQDEDRPIETLFDVTVGITAYARTIANNDERVKLERVSGSLFDQFTKEAA